MSTFSSLCYGPVGFIGFAVASLGCSGRILPIGPNCTPADDKPIGVIPGGGKIKTVFVVVMENKAWSDIKGNLVDAPYINNSLLKEGAFAENYHNPRFAHPSETNYIWLEAGSNLDITTDDDPDKNGQSTKSHLVSLLAEKGVTWRSYQEGIDVMNAPSPRRRRDMRQSITRWYSFTT